VKSGSIAWDHALSIEAAAALCISLRDGSSCNPPPLDMLVVHVVPAYAPPLTAEEVALTSALLAQHSATDPTEGAHPLWTVRNTELASMTAADGRLPDASFGDHIASFAPIIRRLSATRPDLAVVLFTPRAGEEALIAAALGAGDPLKLESAMALCFLASEPAKSGNLAAVRAAMTTGASQAKHLQLDIPRLVVPPVEAVLISNPALDLVERVIAAMGQQR